MVTLMSALQRDLDAEVGPAIGIRYEAKHAAERRSPLLNLHESQPLASFLPRHRRIEADAVVADGTDDPVCFTPQVDVRVGRFRVPHDVDERFVNDAIELSLIHISEPTRLLSISYAVF